MKYIFSNTKQALSTFQSFLRWAFIGVIVGIVVGLCGTAFAYVLKYATSLREQNPWILFLLPVLGLIIVFIYKLAGVHHPRGTNLVLLSVRTEETIPIIMAPLIFISTVLSHLGGASAGREGAALQMGGSISQQIGRIFKADEKSMHIFSMCGMSACFAALFGTPVAAAIFSLEVVSVGIMQYSALIPCAIAALTADIIAKFFHVHHMQASVFELSMQFDLITGLKVCALALCGALVSILFCAVLRISGNLYEKYLENPYKRIIVGGILIIVATMILQTSDYMGAGEQVIINALSGNAKPEAFILKILFTALALEAGFKGGEIVPTLFIGSTFGCIFASIIGISPAFGAALGMIALFCGVTNCPITSIFLGLELLQGAGIEWLLLTVAVSYMLSGYYSLYSQQKIMYSKDMPKFINKNAHQ